MQDKIAAPLAQFFAELDKDADTARIDLFHIGKIQRKGRRRIPESGMKRFFELACPEHREFVRHHLGVNVRSVLFYNLNHSSWHEHVQTAGQ